MTIYIEPEYVTRLEDENNQLKQENYEMQNALIEQQLTKYDNIKYINQLKQELFNAYLEIESDNVNIQLSHYHIKKLLEIIDEHTLINPYTD